MRYTLRKILRRMYNIREMLYTSNNRKLYVKYAIYGACLFIVVSFTFSPQLLSNRSQNTFERLRKFPTDMKYVLIWTNENNSAVKKSKHHFVPRQEPPFANGQTLFIKQKCPYINCYITYNKSLLTHHWYYDALVFDIHEIKHKKIESFNWTRAAHQKYIFRSLESSEKYYICHKSYDNFFNWTWTYRLDSDIPHPYLSIYDMNSNIIGPSQNISWMNKMNRVNRFDGKVKYKEKAVAWIVNDCKEKNRHEDFYNAFKKELESWNYTLDTFGSCGKKPCPDGALYKCHKMIEKKYFFQMVTENYVTEDYVSDKIVKIMQLAVIPIVVGGANYSRFLPPGSYIDPRTVDIKKLGAIINYLMVNKPTYTYLFDWKNHYTYNTRPRNYVCDLCTKLNEMDDRTESKKHFRRWWRPDYEDICLQKRLYYKFSKDSQITESN